MDEFGEHTPAMVQRSVQLIRDFKFKRYLVIQIEVVVLALITSTGSNVLLVVVPYTIIFMALCLIIGITGSQKSLSIVSSYLTIPFFAILLVDLPSKYLLQARNTNMSESYLGKVIGLSINPSSLLSLIEFLLKTLLFLI